MPMKKCLIQNDINKIEKAIKDHKPATAQVQALSEREIEDGRKAILDRSDMSTSKDYYRVGGKWYLKGQPVTGSALDRINKLAIPPVYENAMVSIDPNAKIQTIGRAQNGKWQPRYSAEHMAQKAVEKFNRAKLFGRDIGSIRNGITDGLLQEDTNAMLLRLEDKTAIRIGTAADLKAKKKAYGLTTLKNKHVDVVGDTISLDFTAKEGLAAHYEIKDKVLADWLRKRKTQFADDLFTDSSADKLNKYLKKAAGGKKYTIKDFRTYHGTKIAFKELKQYENQMLSPEQKKSIVKKTLDKVSSFLHNTPAMAKKSYIDPMIWQLIGGI
jgi:DNA topoisomerase-1